MFTRPPRLSSKGKSRRSYRSAPQEAPKPLPSLRTLSVALLGGGLIAASMVGYGLWRSGDRFISGLKLMFTPAPPEDKVDTRTLIVEQIRGASELTTAVFSMQAVVPTESNRTVGGYVVGKTNLLYVAHGDVRAGIDLSDIAPSDITVAAAGETEPEIVTITLPPPKILDSKIDITQSEVYDYDRGFLKLGPDRAPELQNLAQREALGRIQAGACDQGILDMASDRARLVIQQLIEPLGYGQVVVDVAEPEGCP